MVLFKSKEGKITIIFCLVNNQFLSVASSQELEHVCKEEDDEDEEEEEDDVLTDQRLQERSSSLDIDDLEPPQIKEEPEEVCTSEDGEVLALKQEADTFTLSVSYEDGDLSEDRTPRLNEDDAQSAAEEESVGDSPPVKSSDVPEGAAEQRLLPHSSQSAESQGLTLGKRKDSESTKKKTKPKTNHTNKTQSTKVIKTATSKKPCNTQTGQKSLKCDTCGKAFPCNSKLIRHLMIHTGVKPYSCNICGKNFTQKSALNIHKRIHTGEKPYSCNFCGYRFRDTSTFKRHLKRHTTEKPYQQLCNQDRTLSRNQAGPEPPQIKEEEEEEELCASQDRDGLY